MILPPSFSKIGWSFVVSEVSITTSSFDLDFLDFFSLGIRSSDITRE